MSDVAKLRPKQRDSSVKECLRVLLQDSDLIESVVIGVEWKNDTTSACWSIQENKNLVYTAKIMNNIINDSLE